MIAEIAIAYALAAAAEALVGSRFRLHGRDPATGLDCVGVLAAALTALGRDPVLPAAYALRTRCPTDLHEIANACGMKRTYGVPRRGDVAFVRMGATQHHLLIATETDRFVHAHAGLRRVAIHAAPLAWPLVALWRLDHESEI